ncbi:uncharacterized protein LOC117288101 [Asterias rubens]|uniref:uncharacterized protein LOC117288101 n=1 Tax=Asterias rubens TaxID=7604 RepID=UPI00145552B7|nr:uncharacterized protein LOC117288101 [Asterias rubens]
MPRYSQQQPATMWTHSISSFPCIAIWIVVFTASQVPAEACNMLTEGWMPTSLENRTVMAQVVIAGTVVRLRDRALTPPGGSGVYSAEVRVDEVYKGYPFFNQASALSYPDPGDKVYLIRGFGSRERCLAQVSQGKKYIIFLTAVPVTGGREEDGVRLIARYDDIFGAAVEFDAEQERKIHNVVGWRSWAPWSPCPVSCGDGIQTRRRMCVQDVPDACEGAAEQNRHCNLFECSDVKDLLQYMSLSSFPAGVRRSPRRWRAFHVSQDAVLKVPISRVYPEGFPEEFSILLVVKPPRYFASNLNGYLYAVLITGPDGEVQLGVQLSSSPALVFSRQDAVTGKMRPDAVSFSGYSVLERKWHMLAFSVRRDSVTMFADCTREFGVELEDGQAIRVNGPGDISIGNSKPNMIDMYFEGDIEQLALINDPDAAALQCAMPMGTFASESTWTALNITDDLQKDTDSHLTLPVLNSGTTAKPRPKGPGKESHAPIALDDPPTTPTLHRPDESGSTNDEQPYNGAVPENVFPLLTEHTIGPQTTTAVPFYNENFFDVDIDVIDWAPDYSKYPSSIPLPDKDINYKEGNEIFYVHPPGSPSRPTSPSKIPGPTNPSNEDNNLRTKAPPNSIIATTTPLVPPSTTTQITTVPTTVPTTEPTTLPRLEPTTKPTTTTIAILEEATTTVPSIATTVDTLRRESAYRPEDGDAGRHVSAFRGNPGVQIEADKDANWSTWSTCSRTCGTGTRYRFTRCRPDSRLRDCKTGRGIAAQTVTCKLDNCNVPALKWSAWSMCSRTCGDGVEMRMAYCYDNNVPGCESGQKIVVERNLCRNRHCFDVCKPSCKNGGFCRSDGHCACQAGFVGASCETELCSRACQHGGQCVAKDYCLCPAGTAPPTCTPVCDIRCRNGGTCVAPNQCECPPAFTGSFCGRAACIRPCQNGGTCTGPDQCSCPAGYQGRQCESPFCTRACENGGTCIRPDFCRCPTAYRGLTCQIAYCRVTCRNGGRCTGPDKCTCMAGFSGSFCQKRRPRKPIIRPQVNPAIAPYPSNFARTKSAHSQRRQCKLKSTLISYQRSYVKPVARTVQVQCGYWTQQLCTQTRMGYETAYRTFYRATYRRECLSIARTR